MIRTHRLVDRAIAQGRLKRLPCEVCGRSPARAHHNNYRKPLDVIFLCGSHHKIIHNTFKMHQLNKMTKEQTLNHLSTFTI